MAAPPGDAPAGGDRDLAPGPRPAYAATARSPRLLVLLVLLLGAAAVCGRLGVWQLDRAVERGEAAARAEAAALTQDAEPLADVLAPQTSFRGDLVGRSVLVEGTFGADELLVVGRAHEGRTGVLVLSPFETTDGAVLPVVRGWVPDAEAAAALEPPPAGRATLTGYLQGGESAGDGGLPDGQVDAVSPAELVNRWGGPMYSAYLVLAEADPAQDPAIALLGAPSGQGGGLNLQNLAYALQWWVFGGFAVVLWGRMVRDEARAALEDDGPDEVDGRGEADGPDEIEGRGEVEGRGPGAAPRADAPPA